MFYKGNKTAAYAAIGLSLAAISSSALADVLVTSSTGAAARSYPRGARLPDNQTFVLGTGDSVSVLASGGTRRFTGPGRFSASATRQIAGSALASRQTSRSVARTGVARGLGTPLPGAGAPQIGSNHPMFRKVWQVDIGESGAFCFVPEQSVTLWRSDAAAPLDVTVTRAADGTSHTVGFASGQWSHDWPEDVAAGQTGEYRIGWAGAETATHVTFTPLTVDSADPVAVGEALLANGCASQFDALVAQAGNADDEEG